MIYWEIFLSFFKIGAFSFGGGYAALPLIQAEVVDKHAWVTMAEFVDLITISQTTPGPIGINSATFIGLRMGGYPGAILASVAYTLPSLIIVSLIAVLYTKYKGLKTLDETMRTLRPAVVAMIASAGLLILSEAVWGGGAFQIKSVDWVMLAIFVVSLYLLRRTNLNSILIMFLAGIINMLYHWIVEV